MNLGEILKAIEELPEEELEQVIAQARLVKAVKRKTQGDDRDRQELIVVMSKLGLLESEIVTIRQRVCTLGNSLLLRSGISEAEQRRKAAGENGKIQPYEKRTGD